MNNTIYRRKGTDILVQIAGNTDGRIKLHVVSGPLLIDDFGVSKRFFYKNFCRTREVEKCN